MNLLEIFAEQVRTRPLGPAIVEPCRGIERSTSFEALALRSAKLATYFHDQGIRQGDSVLLVQPISSGLYSVLLALFRLGAVAVFLDPSAGREHIERCCEVEPPRALVASPMAHLLRLVCGSLQRVPLKFVFGPALPGAMPLRHAERLRPFLEFEGCSPDAPALVSFTSGSTGSPKATVRTHAFLRAQHRILEHYLKLVPGEVDLCTLPIFLLANLASGVTSVIPDADLRSPGAITPEPVLAQIARQRISRVTASPAFFERLLEAAKAGTHSLQGLRKIYTGGAPVLPRLIEELMRAAPEAEIEAVYGSTEAEPIAHLNARHLRLEDRMAMCRGSGLLAGTAIPEIQLGIMRDRWGKPIEPMTLSQFRDLECPAEQIGEIVVAGEHVLKGYLGNRGNAETKFMVDGEVWHRTGDAGKLDADGRLWLLGRCAAKVQDAQGLVYPFAVECVATEHACVHRAAFVGLGGQRLLAVEPKGDFNDTARYELERSLDWAALNGLRILKRLPVDKRHNAKVDYPKLIRLLETQ